MDGKTDSELLLCRTTVNLTGAKMGALVLVDPDEEEIRVYLERRYLIPEPAAASQEDAGDAPELSLGDSPPEPPEGRDDPPAG